MEISSKYKIRKQIWIEPDMYYSEAFNSLSKSAIITLMRCLQKRKWEKVKVHGKKQTIYTNEGFIFPYKEAAFLHIGTTQFWMNIKNLIACGFVDLVYQGGFYQKHDKEKDYNVYQLSERWRKYNTPEFVTDEKPKVLRDQFHILENIKRQELKSPSQKRRGQLHKCKDDKPKQVIDRLHKTEVKPKVIKTRQSLTATAQLDLFQSSIAFTGPSS